ncbi:hypothetical protein NE848_11485 [Gramella jeungdoensis]|uniref:Uncharacterized protein n=1 Tax=Gramella jeungdoensis TaxID=708091 RepID=A0ABT0Z2P6_9FLAO|nr:hypothetical protein [Gramella jeungdoensis]MCM8570005.1 hypothetical protein [Gramella jeungdoensis]
MSHYISASLGGEDIEFTSGLNWRSISALSESGWGIYENYETYSGNKHLDGEREKDEPWPSGFNMGVSGSGNESRVDLEMATKAYKNALLWARAFKESHPELYKCEYDKAVEIFRDINEGFEVYMNGISLREEEIVKNLDDLIKCQKLLTEDETQRAFQQFWRVMQFSYKIYKHTSKGKEAQVYFS